MIFNPLDLKQCGNSLFFNLDQGATWSRFVAGISGLIAFYQLYGDESRLFARFNGAASRYRPHCWPESTTKNTIAAFSF